jgi:hypothetical protein
MDVTGEKLELVVGSRRKGTPTDLPTYYHWNDVCNLKISDKVLI